MGPCAITKNASLALLVDLRAGTASNTSSYSASKSRSGCRHLGGLPENKSFVGSVILPAAEEIAGEWCEDGVEYGDGRKYTM